MGIGRVDYVMLAARLENDSIDYRELEDYYDNYYSKDVTICNGLTAVSDCTSDSYLYIGKVLVKAIGYGGIPPMCPTPEGSNEIKELLKSQFGIVHSLVSVWVFTHRY